MKNILTIDFDIIMGPSIDLYNDKVPMFNWDKLFENNNLFKFLQFDAIHYKRLTNFIIQIIKKIDKNKIFIIEDHGKILNYLPENEDIKLINIDHHHDLGYGTNPYQNINCGNWVYFVKNLKEYIWINNDNSFKLKFKTNIDFITYDLKNINLIDFTSNIDYLFLCLSEPWVPPYLQPLFFTWIDIINNYYNTKFEIDYTKYYEKEQI